MARYAHRWRHPVRVPGTSNGIKRIELESIFAVLYLRCSVGCQQTVRGKNYLSKSTGQAGTMFTILGARRMLSLMVLLLFSNFLMGIRAAPLEV